MKYHSVIWAYYASVRLWAHVLRAESANDVSGCARRGESRG